MTFGLRLQILRYIPIRYTSNLVSRPESSEYHPIFSCGADWTVSLCEQRGITTNCLQAEAI